PVPSSPKVAHLSAEQGIGERNIPPRHEIDAVRDGLFDDSSFELRTNAICIRRRLAPQRHDSEVRLEVEKVPAAAIARAVLRPATIRSLIMNLVKIGLRTRVRIE